MFLCHRKSITFSGSEANGPMGLKLDRLQEDIGARFKINVTCELDQ